MSRTARATLAVLLPMAVAPAGTAAQTVAEVVERMYASAERQAEGIDDYTIIQSALGIETTSHFVKEVVDGRPLFRLSDSDATGLSFSLGDENAGVGDIFLYGPDLIEHGRYAGREEIGGSAVHVIAVDDLSLLDLAQPSAPGDVEFEPRSARLYIDDRMMIARRMEFTGDAITPGGSQEITVSVDMQSFLPVESLFVPYRTVVRIDGLEEVIGPETMAQLQEMERQLAALPPAEREMMERMLGPQLDVLRQMTAGGDGGMTVEVTVADVLINTAAAGGGVPR